MTTSNTNTVATHDDFGPLEERRQVQREVWNTPHNAALGAILETVAKLHEQLAEQLDADQATLDKFGEQIDGYEARLRALGINLEDFTSAMCERIQPLR